MAVLPQVIAIPVVIGSIGVVEFGKCAFVSSALAWAALASLGLGPGLLERLAAAAHSGHDLDQEAELFSSTVAGVAIAVAASSAVLLVAAAPLAASGRLAGGDLLTTAVLELTVVLQLELSPIEVALTGFNGEILWDASELDGQPRRPLDTSRARELIGFEPRCRLIDGLPRAVSAYPRLTGSNGPESRR